METLVPAVQRRNAMTLSLTEGPLYLDLNGAPFSAVVEERMLA